MSRQANGIVRRTRLVALSLVMILTLPGMAMGEEAGVGALDDTQRLDGIMEPSEPTNEGDISDGTPMGDSVASADESIVAEEGQVTGPVQEDVITSQGDDSEDGASDDTVVDEVPEPGSFPEEKPATDGFDSTDEPDDAGQEQEAPSEVDVQEGECDGENGEPTEEAAEKAEQGAAQETALVAQDKKPTPPPSNAVSVKEGTYVIETNVSDEKVLDAAGSSPKVGSNVMSYTYHASKNQRWVIRKDQSSSWYWILSAAGNLKLALGLAPTKDNPRNVGLVDLATAGDAALWSFVKNGTWYNLVNRSRPDLFLDVYRGDTADKTNVQLASKSTQNKKCQRFYLIDTEMSVKGGIQVGEAAYTVSPYSNKEVVAEVRGAKTTSGTNVWLYSANGKDHQKLYLEPDGDGFYTIWVVGTRRVLATETASIVPGNNVVQRYCTSNTPSQKWAMRKNSDGTYTFVNKRTGLALGATGKRQGSNLVGTRDDGYVSTHFRLSRTALLAPGIVEIHPGTTTKVSLDVQKAASSGNANLILWTDSDALNQRFELVKGGGIDLWRIRTASSGGWITDTGTEVRQQGKGSSSATKANTWQVTFRGGGYCFVNRSTGRALDMRWGKTNKGTAIIGYKPNGKDSQHFSIESASLIGPGCYFLKNGTGKYLDIEGDSPYEDARAQLRAKDDYLGQYYTIEKVGNGIRIKNTYSDRYLRVDSSQRVVQGGRSSSSSEKWEAQIEDGGRVSIRHVATGKVIDASDADTVKVANAKHSSAQAWKLESTGYHPFSGYLNRAVNSANAHGSKTGYVLVVDKSTHKVIAMTGGNGYWKPLRIMSCSVGAWNTPTVEGVFSVGSRGTSFGHGYTCWYWTQFYSDYLFHSVLYNPGSKSSVQDGRLGMHISHGCVRMPIGDAHWIYSTIPSGTRVIIYS